MKQFLKNYWLLAGISFLIIAARAFVPEFNSILHGSENNPVGGLRYVLIHYTDIAVAGIILSFAILYYLLEERNYRFNFPLKVVHLTFTVLFLLIYYLNWRFSRFTIHKSQGDQFGIGSMYSGGSYNGLWEALSRMTQPAFIIFCVGQVIFIVHLLYVLYKSPVQRDSSALDQPG